MSSPDHHGEPRVPRGRLTELPNPGVRRTAYFSVRIPGRAPRGMAGVRLVEADAGPFVIPIGLGGVIIEGDWVAHLAPVQGADEPC
jgi:hypothetical protein